MRSCLIGRAFIGFLACIATSSSAHANDDPPEHVQQLMAEGQSLRRNGRCDEALDIFNRVAALLVTTGDGNPDNAAAVHYNRAQCLEDLDRYREAKTAYELAAQYFKNHPRRAADARSKADEMHRRLYSNLTVACNCEPALARVELWGPDGTSPPSQPCKSTWTDLPVGTYRIVGTSIDGIRIEETVTLLGGAEANVQSLHFTATLVVNGPAGLPVKLDGRVVGELPLEARGLAPKNNYAVEVERPGGPPYTRLIELEPGRKVTLNVTEPRPAAPGPTLPPPPPVDDAGDLRAVLPWFLGAGAVGASAIGGLYLYRGGRAEDRARGHLARYDRACVEPPSSCDADRLGREHTLGDAAITQANTDRTIGWIAIGTAAALLGGAVWTFIDAWPAPLGAVEFDPSLDGASLILRGTF